MYAPVRPLLWPSRRLFHDSTMDGHGWHCMLESLNNDVLVLILSASGSFQDLASFIRASPVLLGAFLSAKPTVLLYVAGNILGPATRDAALLAKTSRFTGKDFDRAVNEAVQDYKARLRITSAPWVATIDAKTAVALTHVTRLTQFCVDAFGYFHCRYFKHEMDAAEDGARFPHRPRLSRLEHGRIAQAVLRRQLLALISGGLYWEPRDYPRFVGTLAPLFRSWEWQQISDMDGFLGLLLSSLAYYDRDKNHGNNCHEWHVNYAPNLEAYVQRVKRDLDSDCSVLEFLCGEKRLFRARITIEGLWDFLMGSHYYTTPSPTDSQQPGANDNVSGSGSEFGIRSKPWAWKDALGGQETCRWGADLVKKPSPQGADRQAYERAKSALESWRWFGMVFWDRERVEKLKQTSALESCQTGWLVPWQD